MPVSVVWDCCPWSNWVLNPPNRRGTDPYARWCGRGGIARCPPIPIDRRSARRFARLRPGWRNAVQPNRETVPRQLRRERRSTQRFSGRIDTSLPEARPCRDDGLGQAEMLAGGAWTETRQPRPRRCSARQSSVPHSFGRRRGAMRWLDETAHVASWPTFTVGSSIHGSPQRDPLAGVGI